jgi:long-chain acyl-CoA synthetase
MDTLYKEFKKTAEANLDRPAVFWKEDDRWRERSYGDFLTLVDSFAAGLESCGIAVGDRVAIYAENRPEWLVSDLAINKIGAVSVPIHATANREYLIHVIKDSGSSVLIASGALYEKNTSFFSDLASARRIILIGSDGRRDEKITTFESLLLRRADESRENDLASIVYTSGTTGEPKGVMLTNANFLANVRAARERINVTPDDKFMSFLPLSHVLERTAGSFIPILTGSAIAYAESVKKLVDDLKEARPTILISVPRIFEKMEVKIVAGIKAKGGLAQKIFHTSLKKDHGGVMVRLADLIMSRKIAAVFGGRLRFAVSGGASLDPRILRFFDNLGIRIIEGYGMTETSPVISVNPLGAARFGTVGIALKSVEVKISLEKEIMVKGANVMQGFWNLPEVTQEKFTSDGWLLTGDLGFLDKDGYLTLIGRKKEMIATTDGKKVNPEKLEAALEMSPYISQSLVIGHGREALAALIVPELENFEPEAMPDVCNMISAEVDKFNAKAMPHERIKRFELLERPFTIEAEELTPTLKLRRHIIEKKYAELIEKIYRN